MKSFSQNIKTYCVTNTSEKFHDLFLCISRGCKTLISLNIGLKGFCLCYSISTLLELHFRFNLKRFTFVGCSVIQQTAFVSANEEYRKLMDQHNEESISPELKEDLGKVFLSRYSIEFCQAETEATSFPCQAVQQKD